MKKLLIVLALGLISTFLYGQDCSELKTDPDIRQELQDMANSAASKLMSCCSRLGGRNNRAEIIWDKDESGVCQTRISKLTNRITITLTAYWSGSMSGTQYWIKGRLIIDGDSKSKSWEKISDSGGFTGGCGKSCIY